ncbi:anthranilate synthase component I [Paenibacillus sp. 2RAB27]|uniref:Anthranilate synthase component 1 n=1 Tax=Paenibacillus allorhizoplanae TaxID=2905648 RepID=A0ABN8G1Y6_9BACL|nr:MULTISPECIES: anthranilate synthase component I [Paenibacillus]KRE69265.1 anthranilate synthase [Paenibacillus sp. Soil750]CAH1197196.1 Anthranilate synthase component 1 [Paenibacillus allorhizoplanae]
MYTPELQEVIRLSKDYNLIPVVRHLLADTETPIRVFQHLYQEPRAFLLESVEGGVKWARYSFLGSDPFLMITAKHGKTTVETGSEKKITDEKPIEVLKAYLRSYSSPQLADLPRFTGGAVGFFGYDLLQYYEKLPAHQIDDLQMNDIQFMFCDQVIVFDHFKQQIKVIANLHVPQFATDADIAKAYQATCEKIDATIEKIKRPLSSDTMTHNPIVSEPDLGEIRSNITKDKFIANVNKAKEYIRAGDIFQVVLSQRFEMETTVSPLQVYRVLRTMNPSPYMYVLKMDDEVIVGTSPELLVRVEEEKVETRPIAGTRPRGKTPEEDHALELELLADEKERAEHLMLVDLGRNDIGRVSEFGTVKCDTFMDIERYSHVMHIVSNVSGKIAKDKDFFDAFLSCMPAGTVSGAPKLRAMGIIAELEPESRGSYAGAIGYLGFSGNLDTCITIRTIVFKKGKAYVQAGAGIVWDSVPESEYQETVNKATALLKSIRMAEAMFSPEPRPVSDINKDYFVNS